MGDGDGCRAFCEGGDPAGIAEYGVAECLMFSEQGFAFGDVTLDCCAAGDAVGRAYVRALAGRAFVGVVVRQASLERVRNGQPRSPVTIVKRSLTGDSQLTR